MVAINLNEVVKVKLTDYGREIYYRRFDKVNELARREVCKPSFPKVDAEGYSWFQLWDFIHLYGDYIGMAQKNVIEPLEIVYEGDEHDET